MEVVKLIFHGTHTHYINKNEKTKNISKKNSKNCLNSFVIHSMFPNYMER